jgi:4-azaleucine resistance transporter AzlC
LTTSPSATPSATFRTGVRDGLPIALGYVSVGFAFGMLAVKKGLPVWSPILISATNFTGTGQFVGIDLMEALVTLGELALTLLIVNLRYLLMSLSLSQRLDTRVTLAQRFFLAFGITDEVYAVSMQKEEPLTLRYLAGIMLCSYLGWVAGTCLGALVSGALPASVQSALGIALYAMFIAIIVPPAQASRPILLVALLSVGLSSLFHWTPGLNRLSSGWVMILCGVISSAVGAALFPVKTVEEEVEP